MLDLFAATDPIRQGYNRIYATLSELREAFHRSGRLDDSNAKLDEVAKLFATYLAFKSDLISDFPETHSPNLVVRLQAAFTETTKLPEYDLGNGSNVFGTNPMLSLRPGDESLAAGMINLVRYAVDFPSGNATGASRFDILNEAFGHFVRDNFRSNIEDAQYMTPPEITEFIADIALQDLSDDGLQKPYHDRPLTILDPACGVGSFLGAVYQQILQTDSLNLNSIRIFGQDKVERMVRLSTLNLQFFNVAEHSVTIGNSLETGSPLDHLNGSVDLILTNPPFGARFSQEYIYNRCAANTPFFTGLKTPLRGVNSELLFIDRSLRLLRDGGRLLIIVPDGVISARGPSALLRHHLAQTCQINAVIELPATTFAQAGTRTKTAILSVRKGRRNAPRQVFMSISTDLGFHVASRKGVQMKTIRGKNEMPIISDHYGKHLQNDNIDQEIVLSLKPSCVAVSESTIINGTWTPKHYSAERIQAVDTADKHAQFHMIPLRELVDFQSAKRKTIKWHPGCAFISILHVIGEGFVDIGSALDHAPKTPGLPVRSGEILLARINPRIPRVCVAPDLGVTVLCSSEFEIMIPSANVDAYTLSYLLQTNVVQNQIRSLTSGTSASHNRIRTSELGEVLVPIAKPGTEKEKLVSDLMRDYRQVVNSLASSASNLAALRGSEAELFT